MGVYREDLSTACRKSAVPLARQAGDARSKTRNRCLWKAVVETGTVHAALPCCYRDSCYGTCRAVTLRRFREDPGMHAGSHPSA